MTNNRKVACPVVEKIWEISDQSHINTSFCSFSVRLKVSSKVMDKHFITLAALEAVMKKHHAYTSFFFQEESMLDLKVLVI